MSRRGGQQPLSTFIGALRLPEDFAARPEVSGSAEVAAAVEWLNTSRPRRQNFWPALVLAFIAQAEALLAADGVDRLPDVFASHPPQESQDGRVVNTLNFTRGHGDPIALRSVYNAALHVIRYHMLREHPKNEAHATQSWRDYRELVTLIHAMRPDERKTLAEWVWKSGVLDRQELVLARKRERVVRPFEFVLLHMPTTAIKGLPGGAMLQAVTYGYFRADSPNLILETHSVNTGSSRAGRLGDVDGYRGGEIELAAEVKDLEIQDAAAVADFVEDIAEAPNATAVVVCQGVTDEARAEIEARNITVLTVSDLTRTVSVWDLPKQQEGLRGVDYYLGRIQRSGAGQTFFREWLREHGLDAGFDWVQATPWRAGGAVAEADT